MNLRGKKMFHLFPPSFSWPQFLVLGENYTHVKIISKNSKQIGDDFFCQEEIMGRIQYYFHQQIMTPVLQVINEDIFIL